MAKDQKIEIKTLIAILAIFPIKKVKSVFY